MSKAKGHKKNKYGAGRKIPVHAIIAIDPGENAGIAVVKDGHVLFSSPAIGSTWTMLAPAVKQAWVSSGCQVPLDQVVGVIEAGWLNGIGRGMKSSLTLSQRRGIAQAALESIGVTRFEFVYSSIWMNAYYGGIHGKDTKQLAMEEATRLLMYAPTSHDQAEACIIGKWAWSEFSVLAR